MTQVSVGHAWLRLRDSLEPAATAWYLAELADRSLEERHPAEPLYLLLKRAYELLDAGMAPGRVARWYEMRLTDELGVRPEVDRCVECDRMLEATDTFRWVPPLGGVLCQREAGPPADRTGLSLEALKLLKAYQRMDVEASRAAARARRPSSARSRPRCATSSGSPSSATLVRCRSSTRFAPATEPGGGDAGRARRVPPSRRSSSLALHASATDPTGPKADRS